MRRNHLLASSALDRMTPLERHRAAVAADRRFFEANPHADSRIRPAFSGETGTGIRTGALEDLPDWANNMLVRRHPNGRVTREPLMQLSNDPATALEQIRRAEEN